MESSRDEECTQPLLSGLSACAVDAAKECNEDYICAISGKCNGAPLVSAVQLLPCMHSQFCRGCISKMVALQTQQRGHESVRCPICRTPFVEVVPHEPVRLEVRRRIRDAYQCCRGHCSNNAGAQKQHIPIDMCICISMTFPSKCSLVPCNVLHMQVHACMPITNPIPRVCVYVQVYTRCLIGTT